MVGWSWRRFGRSLFETTGTGGPGPGASDIESLSRTVAARLVWLLPACLAVTYALLAAAKRLLYHTYDEPRLANLAERILEPNDCACPIVLMHPWLGMGLATLAELVPGVRWFALVMLTGYTVALWRILHAMRRHGCGAGSMMVAASVCLVGYALFEPAFTIVAALLVAAAVFPLLVPDSRAPERPGGTLVSVLLLALGVGFRDNAAILAFTVAGTTFVALRGGDVLRRTPAALRAVGALAVAGVVLGGLAWIGRTVPATSAADRYRAYYRRNVEITDYHRTTFDASWAEALDLSANDFAMIRRHFVTDSGPFRLERLAALPANGTRTSVASAALSLAGEAPPAAGALLAILVLGCVLRPRLSVTVVVSLALLVAIRWACDRMQPRVLLPTLALPALVAVATTSLHGRRVPWSWAWPVIVMLCGWLTLEPWSARARRLRPHQRDEAIAWAFCDERGIRPFHWGPNARSLLPFHRPTGAEAEAVTVGSWANSHPARLKRIRSLVGDDLYAALVREGAHHVVTGAGDRSVVETFLKEHGTARLHLSRVLELERAVVLRVDGAADPPPDAPPSPVESVPPPRAR